jgi:inorganic pyrophosphatase
MIPPPGIGSLPTFDRDGLLLAVIEAGQGSANKLKFDPVHGVFRLHAVLPLGMAYPYDFGFVPGTLGEDGDPLDVLVLMDEAVPAGCVVPCRLLGVIEAEQRDRGAPQAQAARNDRLLAVAAKSHRYPALRSLQDLADPVVEDIERFFVGFNDRKGVDFRPLGRAGPEAARRLVDDGRRAAARASDSKRG